MISLMTRIMKMRFPWNLWVMILAGVNLLGPILFWKTLEGKVALVAMMGAMAIMVVIHKKVGFVRLLGLGHLLAWIPFLAICIWRLSLTGTEDTFRLWLVSVSIFNGISLVFDAVDVWRYLGGDREELA